MPSLRALKRLFRYAVIGTASMTLDVAILWTLTEHFGIYYLVAAIISFITAVSAAYAFDRHFVFTSSHRDLKSGYVYFIAITGAGLLMTTFMLATFVEIFGMHYLLAKILAAIMIGLWNYLMNLYFNFKVAGTY